MSNSKPSFLVITGSFTRPSFYDPVVNAVEAKGYEIRALHSPSVGLETGPREGEPPTMFDDAAFIAKETEKLADESKNVILIAHSYGGVPATESTKGLGRGERQAQGKKGGIIRLAYMTAMVPAVGKSGALVDVPEENLVPLKMDEKGWLYHDSIERSAEIAFSDLPKEEGEAWARTFSRHSAASFGGELTHAGYKDIPVSYLVCENDRCIPPKNQGEIIEMIEKVSGRKVDVTSIQADHCPPVSAPQKVIDWILDIAAKV